MTTKMKGADALVAALRRLPPEVAEAAGAAIDQGAHEIADRARLAAPKATGELAQAITVRDTPPKGGGGAVGAFARLFGLGKRRRGARPGSPIARWVGVFPDKRGDPGWYAVWVEFGTKSSRAQPFLRPAYISLRKRVVSRISRASGKAIRAVAARHG